MILPNRNIGGWAHEIIEECTASRDKRLQKGIQYRNLYLTGDSSGDPQIYPRTYSYIDNLSSFLYSPVELRFSLQEYGLSNAVTKAKNRAGASEFHKQFRRAGVDEEIEDVVSWSLVKGKAFIKLLWNEDGFDPYVIQPEMMGVLREDVESLDRQEAFVHTTYLTRTAFASLIANRPDRDDIIRKVSRLAVTDQSNPTPDMNGRLMSVIIGGTNPYVDSNSPRSGKKSRGSADWLDSPSPNVSPEVLASLIRLDELWVKDDERDDYTTIQIAGDSVVLTGELTHRNVYADMYDPDNKRLSLPTDLGNPLSGEQPFREICPNRLDGYFWGRSELNNVALLQESINQRINGINNILRHQENPSRYFTGGGPSKSSAYATLNKPGGYLVESNPTAKNVQTLAPEMPGGLWQDLHEYEGMFDQMAGFTPSMSGRGDTNVRAGQQVEQLVKMASPRFKDRALIVERQIESIGSLGLAVLRAKEPRPLRAWVMPNDKSLESSINIDDAVEEAPVEGMKPVDFTFHDISNDTKVVVDSHSSSPAFSGETRALLFDLLKMGLASGEEVIEHLQPPGASEMMQTIIENKIQKAKWAAEHPQEVADAIAKKKKK